MADWYTVDNGGLADERLLAAWRDAPVENQEVCGFILEAARDQVIAYAPELTETTTIVDGYLTTTVVLPTRYVYAQLQQAKNLLMAGSVARGGEYGDGEFSYEPRPLDKAIKNLIRPVDGKPHVL